MSPSKVRRCDETSVFRLPALDGLLLKQNWGNQMVVLSISRLNGKKPKGLGYADLLITLEYLQGI